MEIRMFTDPLLNLAVTLHLVYFTSLLLCFWWLLKLYQDMDDLQGFTLLSTWWSAVLVFFSVPFCKKDAGELCLAYLIAVPILLVYSMWTAAEDNYYWSSALLDLGYGHDTDINDCTVPHRHAYMLASFRSYDGRWHNILPLLTCFAASLAVCCYVFRWAKRVGGYDSYTKLVCAASLRTLFVVFILTSVVREGLVLNGRQSDLAYACESEKVLSKYHLRSSGWQCRIPTCFNNKNSMAIPVDIAYNGVVKGDTWRSYVLGDAYYMSVRRLVNLDDSLRLYYGPQEYLDQNEIVRVEDQFYMSAETLSAMTLVDATYTAVPFVPIVIDLCIHIPVAFCCIATWCIKMAVGILGFAAGVYTIGSAGYLELLKYAMIASVISAVAGPLTTFFKHVVQPVLSALCSITKVMRGADAVEYVRRSMHALTEPAVGIIAYSLVTQLFLQWRVNEGVHSALPRLTLGVGRLLVVMCTGVSLARHGINKHLEYPALPVALAFGHEFFFAIRAGVRFTEPLLALLVCVVWIVAYMFLFWHRDHSSFPPNPGMISALRKMMSGNLWQGRLRR